MHIGHFCWLQGFLNVCRGEDLHLCLWQGRLCRWQGWEGAAKPPPSCSTSWWWCSPPPHQICLQFCSPFTRHRLRTEELSPEVTRNVLVSHLLRFTSPDISAGWDLRQRETRRNQESEKNQKLPQRVGEVHCTRIKRGLGQILGRTSGRYDAATQATTSLSGRAPTHADRFSAVLTGRAGLLLLSVKFAFRLLAWMKTDKRLFGYNVLIADRFSAVLTGRVGLLLLSVKFAFRLRVDELAYSYFQ